MAFVTLHSNWHGSTKSFVPKHVERKQSGLTAKLIGWTAQIGKLKTKNEKPGITQTDLKYLPDNSNGELNTLLKRKKKIKNATKRTKKNISREHVPTAKRIQKSERRSIGTRAKNYRGSSHSLALDTGLKRKNLHLT